MLHGAGRSSGPSLKVSPLAYICGPNEKNRVITEDFLYFAIIFAIKQTPLKGNVPAASYKKTCNCLRKLIYRQEYFLLIKNYTGCLKISVQ